jgi:hypothetical protein
MSLTAVITTIRHGHKDKTGNLTDIGHKQSKERAVGTLYLKGDVILFHSGVQRVRDTILTAGKFLHIDNLADAEKVIAETNLQDYASPFLHYLYRKDKKGEFFGHWDDIEETPDAVTERMNGFLDQGSNSLEPEIYPAPLEMAKRLARVLVTEIEFATLTEETYRTNFINGTHEPVIMAFLYYFLNDFKAGNRDFLSGVGGSVNFAEGFEFLVSQSAEKIDVEFVFREIKRAVNLRQLKAFAESPS